MPSWPYFVRCVRRFCSCCVCACRACCGAFLGLFPAVSVRPGSGYQQRINITACNLPGLIPAGLVSLWLLSCIVVAAAVPDCLRILDAAKGRNIAGLLFLGLLSQDCSRKGLQDLAKGCTAVCRGLDLCRVSGSQDCKPRTA